MSLTIISCTSILDDSISSVLSYNKASTKRKETSYSMLQPLFNWTPISLIRKTFDLSTQCTRTPASSFLKKTYCSPFTDFNVKRISEPVATDTMRSDTSDVDDSSTCAHIFVGTKTLVTDFYRIKTDKQFVKTLEDTISKRGATGKIISDSTR